MDQVVFGNNDARQILFNRPSNDCLSLELILLGYFFLLALKLYYIFMNEVLSFCQALNAKLILSH